MAIRKEHLEFHSLDLALGWRTPAGYPSGIEEKILAGALDEKAKTGNRTRLLRFEAGTRTSLPFVHDYWEEVFLLSGDLIVGDDKKGTETYGRTLTLAVLPACVMVPSGRRMAAFCWRSIITIRRARVRPGAGELSRRSAGSALGPLLGQRREDRPRAMAGEGGGETRSLNWHRKGPARAANQHIYRRDLALVPIRNVAKKARRSVLRARNGMTAFARTPSLPEATAVGLLTAEAVRKGDVQEPMRKRG
jgi:hypothetical protein